MADNKTDYAKLSAEELVKLLEKKDADSKQSDSVIAELKKEIELKDQEVISETLFPTVKVGADTYDIVIPHFNFYDKKAMESTRYSASDVQKNDKLAAALVKQESGVLRKK